MKLLIVELKPNAPFGCLADMPLEGSQFEMDGWRGEDASYFMVIRLLVPLSQRQVAYLSASEHVTNFTVLDIEKPYSLEKAQAAYSAIARPSDKRVLILDLISAERDRQIAKWGRRRNHRHLYWLGILMEEVGEAAKAVIEIKPWYDIQKELVQVAAVAVAWMECVEDGDIVPEVSDDDAMYISYLQAEGSEGYFAKWFHSGRLGFREGLSEWLGGLMDAAQVSVKGWRPVKKDEV